MVQQILSTALHLQGLPQAERSSPSRDPPMLNHNSNEDSTTIIGGSSNNPSS